MRYLHQIIDRHRDRPAIVVCGGPSAARHIDEWPADAVAISVNEHGLKLSRCDYAVALDDVARAKMDAANTCGAEYIGRHAWAHWKLVEFWDPGLSGPLACWVAAVLGCLPVVVTGADCYQGGTYWWDADANSSGRGWPLDQSMRTWQSLRRHCPGAVFRALGGPLEREFGRYDPTERIQRPEKMRPIMVVPTGVHVRFVRPTHAAGCEFVIGQEAHLSARDARAVINAGKALEVSCGC